MKLVNWNTNNSISGIFDNFDCYFNGLVHDSYKYKRPNVSINDDNKNYFLSLDIPGVNKGDIEITVNDGVMNIKCERKKKNDTFSYSEVSNFNYERSFYIPDNANENKIKAKSNNGVLLIEIPKLKKVKKNSKKIDIS